MPAQVSYLYKYCPACGGRARAEAKLPLAHAQRPEEYNLDDLGTLVERQTIGFLLALVELLPYKVFTCRKCGHEFQLQNRAAKDLVYSMLAAMQPVAAALSPAQAARRRQTVRLPPPGAMPAPVTRAKPVRPAASTRPKRPPAPQVPVPPVQPTHPPDWEPYHLDNDMDDIFDQFTEE
jgi:hypothetical protein